MAVVCSPRWVIYIHGGRRFHRQAVHHSCLSLCSLAPVTVLYAQDCDTFVHSRPPSLVHLPPAFGPCLPGPVLFDPVTAADFLDVIQECSEASWFITRLLVPDDVTSLFVDFICSLLLSVSRVAFPFTGSYLKMFHLFRS